MPTPAFPTTYTTSAGLVVPLPIPEKPIKESVKMNNLIQTFESGDEQRRQKGDPRRTFELTYPFLPEPAFDKLYDFFIARRGSVESFTWVHPVKKTQYLVRFDQDAFDSEYHLTTHTGHWWKCSIKLIQVL